MIRYVVAHRLRRGARSIVSAGVLLGLVLGVTLASFAVARDTASSYGRVLAAADAETLTVAHSRSPEEAAAVLDRLPGIARHRYQAGFIGFLADEDAALVGALLAPADDAFALELPTLTAGRFPVPHRADEVFVNTFLAEEGGIEVGDDITILLVSPDSDEPRETQATVAGIGTLPREAVADDTALNGIIVPTRAFYEAHEDLRVYANSRVWLDEQTRLVDLAAALSEEGFEVSETRAQERSGVEEALRPSITVLVALGLLASVATVVLAGQAAQRQHDRWRADDAVLAALGADRPARAWIHLASVAVQVGIALVVSTAMMLVASPRAPIGPLRDLDPGQGVHIDLTVAVAGWLALGVVLTAATLPLALRTGAQARTVDRPGQVTTAAQRPSSLAGLSLAVHTRRRSGLRLAVAAASGAALLAGVATVAVSARTLVESPERYGVNFDLLAINAFGDQTVAGIERAFGGKEVEAVASYTSFTFLVGGNTVPGLGLTPVRGDLGPTILEGEPLRHDDEVVLGVDTSHRLDAQVGEEVEVQTATSFDGGPPPRTRRLRVVGLATFAAISQQGTDEARLGNGAVVTAATLEAMVASTEDDPEWTVAALADGESPADLIAANPDGIEEPFGIPTRWFTQVRPAELVQLDAAAPVLLGAVTVSFMLLAALLVQGTWGRARASRAELSVLQALGCSRRQLARAAAWQPVPAALASLVVGVPLGIAGGRLGFSAFARSIAVMDDPSSPAWLMAGIVLAVAASVGVAALVSASVASHVPSAATLRDAAGRGGG
ncbi:MAG: FtsX-like permease family protein [Acidimicrobiales bacterium]